MGGPGEDGLLHSPRIAGRDEARPGHGGPGADARLNTTGT